MKSLVRKSILIVAVFNVATLGLPVKGIHQALGSIACQACLTGHVDDGSQPTASGSVTGEDPGPNRTALLNDLTLKVEESNSAALSLLSQVSNRWTRSIRHNSRTFLSLKRFVARRLRVNVQDDDGSLSGQERDLVHGLLSAARFILYLENQENLTVYGDQAASLTNLKGRLQQVVCSARLLLARLSDQTIRGFLDQNVNLRRLRTAQSSPALQRVVCSLVLEKIVAFLSGVTL
ncbi:hypothetical protein RRG08_064104 [Elysia crispata]|uniref:Uncharacterized protein n=1 Tax=Elysia crispata TaxID=231223 RepID=A0AAE1A692_9GAST|nr:hypothetical protein RRG08_064104 [Elysia crispata]